MQLNAYYNVTEGYIYICIYMYTYVHARARTHTHTHTEIEALLVIESRKKKIYNVIEDTILTVDHITGHLLHNLGII